MPRGRRSRLSWFRFFTDDFLGGISRFTVAEIGCYVLLLIEQFKEGEIPPDKEEQVLVCRGTRPSARVLRKFFDEPFGEHGRNYRMDEERAHAKRVSESATASVRTRYERTPDVPTNDSTNRGTIQNQNQNHIQNQNQKGGDDEGARRERLVVACQGISEKRLALKRQRASMQEVMQDVTKYRGKPNGAVNPAAMSGKWLLTAVDRAEAELLSLSASSSGDDLSFAEGA